MFDVGFTEILLIGIVSLVVIGPERLPAVAKTAGQWIGKLQRFVKGVKTDLASELETGDLKKLIGDQREQINELRDMVSTARKDFQSTAQSVVKDTREGLSELETTINDARSDPADSGDDAKIDNSTVDNSTVDNSTVNDAKDDDAKEIAYQAKSDQSEQDSVSLTKPNATTSGTTDSDRP